MSLRELAAQSKHKGKHVLTVKESKRIRRKGYCAERQLAKKLRRYGFKSVRVPVSAPSNEPLPDVFAMKDETLLAFDFRRKQVEKLFEFLDVFKVYKRKLAIIAGKFPYKWVFKRIEKPDDYVLQKEGRSNISFGD